MAKSRSPLVIIFITVFIDLVGFGIVIPVLPLYASRFDASPVVVGMLLGVFSAMQFIFSPILGKLSDRVGRRPVLLLSLIGTAIGFLIMGLANTLWLLFVGRIIDGITGGNISTAQAYIADVTSKEQRSRAMGLIGAAFGTGFIVGPAIGGLMSSISLAAPFYFAAALAAANAVALYFFLPESLSAEHRSRERQRYSIRQVFEEAGSWQLGAVMATFFFATVAFALLTATYPLFTAREFGYDASDNGYIFAYLGLLGALIQGGLLGRVLKLFGEKPLVVAGIIFMAAGMFALPASGTLTMLLVASTAVAVGNSLVTPILSGLASKSVSAAWQGRALGVLQSAASLGRIIGPVLGGVLLTYDERHATAHFGRVTYWAAAAIMTIALLLSLTLHSTEVGAGEEVSLGRGGET
jgi:DHA1 family tetracycline resistance protein-like MFS transporter